MTRKIAAAMLLATALPCSAAMAHSGTTERPATEGYMYLMVTIGAAYFIALAVRSIRRKHNQTNSTTNKN